MEPEQIKEVKPRIDSSTEVSETSHENAIHTHVHLNRTWYQQHGYQIELIHDPSTEKCQEEQIGIDLVNFRFSCFV